MGVIDSISNTFSDAVGLLSKSPIPLFTDIAKVQVLSSLVLLIGVGAVLGLMILAMGAPFMNILTGGASTTSALQSMMASFTSNLLILLVVAVPLVVVVALLNQIISSVTFNIIENRANGKETNMFEKISANLVPVTLYSLLIWVAILIIMSPMFLAVYFGGGLAGVGALCVVLVLLVLLMLLFSFFFQFSYMELILNRRGVIESLKVSFSLVKNNLLTVFLFNIAYIFLALAVTAPLSIIQWFIELMGQVLISVGGGVGLLLYLIIYAVYGLISGIISTFILTPFLYFFWKRISGGVINK